jgi:hypothetical protein
LRARRGCEDGDGEAKQRTDAFLVHHLLPPLVESPRRYRDGRNASNAHLLSVWCERKKSWAADFAGRQSGV